MKQYIDYKQIDELTTEQNKQLKKLVYGENVWVIDEKHVTIGKMIEILEQNNVEWWKELFFCHYEGYEIFKEYSDEICDALWETVKSIL